MIYIVLNHPPGFSSGGIGNVVRHIIDNIEHKNNITLICNGSNNEMATLQGVPIINLNVNRNKIIDFIFLYSNIKFSYKLYSFVRDNIKDGDIVNIHEGNGISFFLNLLRKKINKKFKIITTVHGLISIHYVHMIKYLPFKYFILKIVLLVLLPYYWFVEKIYLMNVDHIINISHRTNIVIKRYYRKEFNSSVIYNGMDKIEKKYNKQTKSTFKPRNAIIVGSVVYPKGLDIAIKSISKFNKNNKKEEIINLHIIGFRDFYNYYDKKKIPSFIKYVGKIKYKNMNEQYKKADFLLFPSRSEEFSLTILEALQYNLPFLVSKECNINEMNNWKDWGYRIDTWNIDDWVVALEKITNINTFNKKWHNINIKDFSSYYWKNVTKQYEDLFNKI